MLPCRFREEQGLGGVIRSGTGDDGDPTPYQLHRMGYQITVFLAGKRRRLTGSPHHDNGVGARLDMPLQQEIERRQVQRTIAVHRRNDRYDAASNLERHGIPLARISTGLRLGKHRRHHLRT